MKAIDYAKAAIIAAEKKHEEFITKNLEYQSFNSLPWYKKLLTLHPVVKPEYHYYEFITLCKGRHHAVELRLYYSGTYREITLAINEDYCGFRLNVDTLEKIPYLGKVDRKVSKEFFAYVMKLRNILAPLIVE